MIPNLLVFLVPLYSFGVSLPANGAIYEEAHRILANVKITAYQHTTDVDETVGRYLVDCSGLAYYALKRSAPTAAKELNSAVKETFTPAPKRPLAKHFVWYFERLETNNSPLWESVSRIGDLQPGDFIAWLKPEDVVSTNTGHVMLVASMPVLSHEEDGRWVIKVIDSSLTGHGLGDRRKKSGPNGVGSGFIGLKDQGDGLPAAYFWKGNEGERSYVTKIKMARLK